MEHIGFKIEVEWLWIDDRQSRFEDSIMPHPYLIHMFLFVLRREDIDKDGHTNLMKYI